MFEKKLARNLKTGVKTFWRYVNNGMKVRVLVGDLERKDGTVATTDMEKAEVLFIFHKCFDHRRQGKHADHGGKTWEIFYLSWR